MSTLPLGPDLGRVTSFSWKRAAVHTLLATVAVVVLGAAAVGWLATPAVDARKLGEAMGRLVGFTAAMAFTVSWLRQTGRHKAALGVAIGCAALFAAGVVAVAGGRGHRPPAMLTAAERAPLLVVDQGGERRLRHPAFGFSILHPGPTFRDAPDLAQAMQGKQVDPATQHYAFSDPADRSLVVISVMQGMGGTRASLSEHIDGFQRGFAGSAAGGGALRWLSKEVTWNDERHEAHLGASFGGDARLALTAYAVTTGARAPLIVDVMVVAPQIERFTKMLASFHPQ